MRAARSTPASDSGTSSTARRSVAAATPSQNHVVFHPRLDAWDRLQTRTIDAGPIEAWTLSLSADGQFLASGSQGGNVNLWNTTTGEKQSSLRAGEKFVMSVACSPDGKNVACGAEDGTVTIFDVQTGQQSARLTGHALTVRTLAFSKDSVLRSTGPVFRMAR